MLWKLFLKSKLRSYADKNGCMMLCDQEKPSKYFTAKKIRVDLTHDTSEAVRRPPMGINLAAATIEGGMEILKLFGSDAEATSIPKLNELLGDEMHDLAKFLNVENKECTDKAKLEKKVERFLEHLGKKIIWSSA